MENKRARAEESGGRACLIAVGGAKGGVGKSIFTTNLAVSLASKGHRTVVVDLDLGGANQHLYLGYKSLLASTLNDFVKGRARSLREVTVETRYGPRLIGGNSSELGSANLPHARKLKLMRAIREIEADYVLLDLGGDTSYNIVDCFNLADFGVVVTTRESASYVGAYQFIKIALYRKLQRAFGPESRFAHEKDPSLARILTEATTGEGASGRSIDDLVAAVRAQAPESSPLLQRILADFRPYLVTNRIPHGFDAGPLVRSLQDVMRRWLSKDVRHVGSVHASRDVEASAIDLVPVLARFPSGLTALEMDAIAERLCAEARPVGDAPLDEGFEGEADAPVDASAEEATERAEAVGDGELEQTGPTMESTRVPPLPREAIEKAPKAKAASKPRAKKARDAAPAEEGKARVRAKSEAKPPRSRAKSVPAAEVEVPAEALAGEPREAEPMHLDGPPANDGGAAAQGTSELSSGASPDVVGAAKEGNAPAEGEAIQGDRATTTATVTPPKVAAPAVSAPRAPLDLSSPPRPSRRWGSLGIASAREGSVGVAAIPAVAPPSVTKAPAPGAMAAAPPRPAEPKKGDAEGTSLDALEWSESLDGLSWKDARPTGGDPIGTPRP